MVYYQIQRKTGKKNSITIVNNTIFIRGVYMENRDLYQLVEKVRAFCEKREWNQFHSPKELAIGLSTESNELLALFRFKTKEQMEEMLRKESKREAISEELADVFFFLLRFSQMYGFDLEECLEDKLEKNEKKYPLEKTIGKNTKYNEL